MEQTYITLNNGIKMPQFGIGTFLLTPEQAENSVLAALQDKYLMVDTANAYINEKAVGRAIEHSGVSRDKLFVSTKLWPSEYENKNAVEETLSRLNLDYVDLLFLHQPAGNWKAGYKQLEEACKAGRIRSIGISNFEGKYMDELLDWCEIKPQVIQVEAHPYFTQEELRKTLDQYGIKLMAWYPLGHGDKSLLQEKVFADLAAKYKKTPAQIILRWHIQMGFIVIPGSKNPDHVRQNIDIFDFALTDDEMAEIAKINKNVRYYHRTDEQLKQFASYSPQYEA
ncbi:MAG: aldo/keto reductase [Anaerovoracaceae bacterium]|jgi:diketogulonate reductase-like aldo/keto reductase